jgi:hypothetical protein
VLSRPGLDTPLRGYSTSMGGPAALNMLIE